MSTRKKGENRFREFRNSKAARDYFLEEKWEAGIVLTGTEVKSIRQGGVQINDAYVRTDKEQMTLLNAHIAEYAFGNYANHQPTRPRRLLLNKREIRKLIQAVQAGGRTVVPTRMYFKKGLVKVEIALAKGKKLYDKREDLKEKVVKRELDRAMKQVI